MPQEFPIATPEQVVNCVEAVFAYGGKTKVGTVANFLDLQLAQTQKAIDLACDFDFLKKQGSNIVCSSPLCRFFATPNQKQKAAILRLRLESFEPFTVFRERLIATNDAKQAAKDTKKILDLMPHHDELKESLVSFGTFTSALIKSGGGNFEVVDSALDNDLLVWATACEDRIQAEARIREQIDHAAFDETPRAEILEPLATGLLRAVAADAREAVQNAGNAVESFLVWVGTETGLDVTNKPGINAKAQELTSSNKIAKKHSAMAGYLGHIRNAADHGVDADVGKAWDIQSSTGLEYVYVSLSFIRSVLNFVRENKTEI